MCNQKQGCVSVCGSELWVLTQQETIIRQTEHRRSRSTKKENMQDWLRDQDTVGVTPRHPDHQTIRHYNTQLRLQLIHQLHLLIKSLLLWRQPAIHWSDAWHTLIHATPQKNLVPLWDGPKSMKRAVSGGNPVLQWGQINHDHKLNFWIDYSLKGTGGNWTVVGICWQKQERKNMNVGLGEGTLNERSLTEKVERWLTWWIGCSRDQMEDFKH